MLEGDGQPAAKLDWKPRAAGDAGGASSDLRMLPRWGIQFPMGLARSSEGSEEWLLLSWGWGDSDSVLSRVRLSELMQELRAL